MIRTMGMESSKEEDKIMNGTLTALTGEKWKVIRSVITPVFTSGKLKKMAPLMHEVSENQVYGPFNRSSKMK